MRKTLLTLLAAIAMNHALAQSEISDFFRQLKTYSANFSQVVTQDDKVVQRSTGHVWLKKPLKFRWNYETPEKMQLVSDGKQFYHYDVDLAQVTVKPVTEVTDSALTTLLSDKERIEDVFRVKSFAAPAVKNRFPQYVTTWLAHAVLFYELSPKQNDSSDNQVKQVVIGLTADRQLSVFYARDDFGENNFIFSNIQQNSQLSKQPFTFKAPRGVDVFGQ